MLVNFTVKNLLSFKEEQTLSYKQVRIYESMSIIVSK